MIMKEGGRPFIVAIEGSDGSGKSLQCDLLLAALCNKSIDGRLFQFHDRSYAKQLISNFATNGLINREMISAALFISFMATMEEMVRSKASVAIFHRYKYTGMLKDWCHGIPSDLTNINYSQVPDPDLFFYLDISPEDALARIIKNRGRISFYETSFLYTYGSEYVSHLDFYKSGIYDITTLSASFLEQKRKESLFWNKLAKETSFCHIIDANMAPGQIHSIIFNKIISMMRPM